MPGGCEALPRKMMLRKFIRYIAARTWKPWLERKLSKPVHFSYKDITLLVPPGVFHPGYFNSTLFLLEHLDRLPLQGKKFLELGCGSGLISIAAAKKGASVTATDISFTAIQALKANAKENSSSLDPIRSDQFNSIPAQAFDIIAINPPYYKGTPQSEKDHAWYCGENYEYFSGLFSGLRNYIHHDSVIAIVLSDDCDLERIRTIAGKNGYSMTEDEKKKFWTGTEFIFRVTPV
jgi:release factor glutamine methyltransferase